MDKKQAFSLALASITLGLTACGGVDSVPIGGTTTATGGGTSTMPPITPAAVACTAPELSEIVSSNFASVCIPASSGGTSSRFDMATFGSSGVEVSKMDFSNASCTTGGVRVGQAGAQWTISPTTTTVASLAADGITPVTGTARTVTLSSFFTNSGSFAPGTPLVTTGTYTICKTTPASTTTLRALVNYRANGIGTEMTPTFVLRSSVAGSSAINTGFGFEGGTFRFFE
jgi:hypothetical protein